MSLSINSQIEANKSKTWLIMAFFTLFISTVAYILGSASGYGISWAATALIISGLISLGSYYWGDKLVLSASGAKPADPQKDPDFYDVIEGIGRTAAIPKPKIYIVEDSAPNAFATGRDPSHAAVCATRGLLTKLDKNELKGVMAHEISHIKNFDTRLMAIVSVLVGMVAFLSDWFMRMVWFGTGQRDREERGSFGAVLMLLGIILAIISPIIATIIQLSISRRREFLADASSALLTKNPGSLAGALEKIAKDKAVLKVATNATAHLFIANPFKGKNTSHWFTSLFDTHPPVEERIKILRSM